MRQTQTESRLRPLIGITTGEFDNKHNWAPKVYGQNHEYSDAILAAGGLPVLVPYVADRTALRDLYERFDGLVFAGGGDIDPRRYGAQPGPFLRDVLAWRDEAELQLMKWAIADDVPVLAICRGFQVMNVALGGTLTQDILNARPGTLNHDLSTDEADNGFIAHTVEFEAGSRLASIVGVAPINANSRHHQTVDKTAPGLIVTGHAEDRIVESVELASARFAIGVQCHPESLPENEPRWGALFTAFVEASRPLEIYPSLASERNSSITEVLEAL